MTKPASRREFLRMAAALSATRFAPPLALNLAALGESAAATATDYKALVCVFMIGGNDNFNTLVPYDSANYAIYNQQRPAIATAASALTPTLLTPATALPGGEQFALAPALSPLLPLFNGGQMAVMLNIGTLVEPIASAAAYASASRRQPAAPAVLASRSTGVLSGRRPGRKHLGVGREDCRPVCAAGNGRFTVHLHLAGRRQFVPHRDSAPAPTRSRRPAARSRSRASSRPCSARRPAKA